MRRRHRLTAVLTLVSLVLQPILAHALPCACRSVLSEPSACCPSPAEADRSQVVRDRKVRDPIVVTESAADSMIECGATAPAAPQLSCSPDLPDCCAARQATLAQVTAPEPLTTRPLIAKRPQPVDRLTGLNCCCTVADTPIAPLPAETRGSTFDAAPLGLASADPLASLTPPDARIAAPLRPAIPSGPPVRILHCVWLK